MFRSQTKNQLEWLQTQRASTTIQAMGAYSKKNIKTRQIFMPTMQASGVAVCCR